MAPAKKAKEEQKSFETHELVPYACHYDQYSLLTKNVELVQTIRLRNSGGLSDDELRSVLRKTLNENINPSKIAVWIHTTRTRKEIIESGNEDYIKHIDVLWKQALPDELRYANHIYISFVMDFKSYPLWQPQNFLRALSTKAEESRFDHTLKKQSEELFAMTESIISGLKKFGAKRLQMIQRNGIYYSEPMEFFHKLMTFTSEPGPIPLGDIAKNLYPEEFLFNSFNSQVSISGKNGTNFASVLSLKESTLLTAAALKELLNTGYELVISEAIDFSFGNKYLGQYKYQKYLNSLSENRKFVEIMGGKNGSVEPTDFALNQISILAVGRSQKELNEILTDLSAKLGELGIVYFIEDIMLERSFWSILPGNFSFLKRQKLVSRNEILAYASFGSDKFTSVDECMFGEPVTFFETSEGGAYALHFLNDGQSNILIAGGSIDERQIVANLIATQGARFGTDVIFYDDTGRYQEFANGIGALYLDILDLDLIKERLTEKTIIVINSLKKILTADNYDFISNFLDYAASKNAMVICCAAYEDNCEALLPNFRTQIFLHGDVQKYADHFDFFEDEIRIVDLLEVGNFYFKHGYEEMVLNFRPTERLVMALIDGDVK